MMAAVSSSFSVCHRCSFCSVVSGAPCCPRTVAIAPAQRNAVAKITWTMDFFIDWPSSRKRECDYHRCCPPREDETGSRQTREARKQAILYETALPPCGLVDLEAEKKR